MTGPEQQPEVVLVGGGHAHVQVVRKHLMDPLPAHVTVVVDRPEAVYSGMVPGLVAGQYRSPELTIDVRPLARRAGVAFVHAAMVGIDPRQRLIQLEGRPPLRYDLASLNLGSTVAHLDVPGVREHALPTRPIADLVDRIEDRIRDAGNPTRVVVVGAGAGGVELAFCTRERIKKLGRSPQITVVAASEMPLPARPGVGAKVLRHAEKRGIQFVGGQRVVEVTADGVVLADGRRVEGELVLWVTGAVAPPVLAGSALPTDDRGFVIVEDTLLVQGFSDLFAVGDCAVLESWPEIPKAGVYAVREGPVLADNLRAALSERPLSPYVPQRDFFTILNFGDGTALGSKWGLSAAGGWMFWWKDRIDRQFMERFQVLDAKSSQAQPFDASLPPMPEMNMICGGCAAKVGEDPLRRALQRAGLETSEDVLGMDAEDDVVAWTDRGETRVANIDVFTAFTDDPWLVGRAGALNALSDIYASGGVPERAMALVTVPDDREPEEVLYQVLAGLRHELDEAGVTLLGGHTTSGETLAVGLSVWGRAERLWTRSSLRIDDVIVITGPIGTGVLWHADGAGRAPSEWMAPCVRAMLRGNRDAASILGDFDISAVTDVTGFGLAGHLGALCRASDCSANLHAHRVPALPGARALLARGERSTFHDQNRSAARAMHLPDASPLVELLFDPQTCGPLLVGVTESDLGPLLHALRAAGYPYAKAVAVAKRPSEALIDVVYDATGSIAATPAPLPG